MRRGQFLPLAVLSVTFLAADCGGGKDLEPVPPPPNLASMSAPVRGQYRETREQLDEMLNEAGAQGADLGRAFGELGLWYHTYQLGQGAQSCYRNARRLMPADPRWSYYLGTIEAGLGRMEEARDNFEAVLKIDRGNVPTLVRLAELEITQGEPGRAREHLDLALSLQPQNVRALVARAKVEESAGDHRQALKTLRLASLLQGGSAQVSYALGLAYRRAGEIEEARRLLAKLDPESGPKDARMSDPWAAELTSRDVGLQGNLRSAKVARRQGQHELALSLYRKATAADSASVEARLGVARSLAGLGRTARAIEELRAALEEYPGTARFHAALGAQLLRVHRNEDARGHFETAIEIEPESWGAVHGLSALLIEQGDVARAHALLVSVPSKDRTEALTTRLVRICIDLGLYSEAREALVAGLATYPGHRELELIEARLLASAPGAEARDGRRALTISRSAYDEFPGFDAAEVLAMALAETGDLSTAAEIQARLMESAREAGREDLLAGVEANYSLFTSGRACRDPKPGPPSTGSIFVDLSGIDLGPEPVS